MSNFKVDKETAEIDFHRFCDKQSIDVDIEDMEEDDIKSFDQQKMKIVKCIMRGTIEVCDNGIISYFYGAEKPLEFKEPRGSSLLAMDRVKSGQDMKGMYNLMGDICGVAPATFAQMSLSNTKVCIAITSLFLAS